jgi:phosphoglycolate phosphatase
LTAALNYMLAQLGREQLSRAKVLGMIGRGVRVLVEKGLAATGSATPELLERGLAIYVPYYEAHIAVHSRPYGGAEAALDLLRMCGARLAICTNKPEHPTRKLLAVFGWTDFFASVIGGDTLPARKPDAAPLLEAVRRAGGGAAVMVGDSITDIETANAARLPSVAVSFGYRDRPAKELGATAVIDRFDELVPALEGLSEIFS